MKFKTGKNKLFSFRMQTKVVKLKQKEENAIEI
jgi:hypothetical protein